MSDSTNADFEYQRGLWATAAVVVGLFVSLLLLFLLIKITGAVVAEGVIVVKTYGKHIQHADGGIVSEILVDDGSEVKEGDVLIRLDETIVRSDLAVVGKSIDKYLGRKARLEAERDHADTVFFPQSLLDRQAQPGIAQLLRAETDYFNFRKSNLDAKTDQLRERVRQLREEIVGYEAQKRAKGEQLEFTVMELNGVKQLVEQGNAALTRQLALDKSRADFEGQIGQLISQIAQAKGRIAETELSIVETNESFLSSAVGDLRDVNAQLNELEERRIAADDKLKRVEIRSPRYGVVHNLQAHTIGGVIKAAEVIMTIVPKEEEMVIEAQVSIDDIDQVELDQEAFIRFTGLNRKRSPEMNGTVTRVAADSLQDPVSKRHYYPVRVAFSEAEFSQLYEFKARPGMAAEVHIKTDERNVLSYLVKPLIDHFERAFLED